MLNKCSLVNVHERNFVSIKNKIDNDKSSITSNNNESILSNLHQWSKTCSNFGLNKLVKRK